MRWHDTGWQYPLEPIRDRYVTPYAGVSYELGSGEIGVHGAALEANTTLAEDAQVVVAPGESRPELGSVPAFARRSYRIVPLDATRPDALRLSPRGEAVFSSFDLDWQPVASGDDARRTGEGASNLLPWLRRGDAVILNAALARLLPAVKRIGGGMT